MKGDQRQLIFDGFQKNALYAYTNRLVPISGFISNIFRASIRPDAFSNIAKQITYAKCRNYSVNLQVNGKIKAKIKALLKHVIYKMNTNGVINWNHESLYPVLVKGRPFNRDVNVKNLRSHVERNTNEAVNSSPRNGTCKSSLVVTVIFASRLSN